MKQKLNLPLSFEKYEELRNEIHSLAKELRFYSDPDILLEAKYAFLRKVLEKYSQKTKTELFVCFALLCEWIMQARMDDLFSEDFIYMWGL